MNLKIKFRESFRPFAPAVPAGATSPSTSTSTARQPLHAPGRARARSAGAVADDARRRQALFGIEKLNVPRLDIPAVTHVDYSARVQTVDAATTRSSTS